MIIYNIIDYKIKRSSKINMVELLVEEILF